LYHSEEAKGIVWEAMHVSASLLLPITLIVDIPDVFLSRRLADTMRHHCLDVSENPINV
jgi:hypothetical protein